MNLKSKEGWKRVGIVLSVIAFLTCTFMWPKTMEALVMTGLMFLSAVAACTFIGIFLYWLFSPFFKDP